MNAPEYSIIDEFEAVVQQVSLSLNYPEDKPINYQHGYIEELNETLIQWSDTQEFALKKYPLVWLVEPFTVRDAGPAFYGAVDGLRVFIITDSIKTLKGYQRRAQKFVPIIDPIRRKFLAQLRLTPSVQIDRNPSITDRYYWGEQQQSQLNDVVDCSEISQLNLKIHHNQNCLLFKPY